MLWGLPWHCWAGIWGYNGITFCSSPHLREYEAQKLDDGRERGRHFFSHPTNTAAQQDVHKQGGK